VPEPPPRLAVDLLRVHTRAVATENLARWSALSETLDALAAGAVPVIALKGAHLAELVYGSIALRPMCDVDLLVPRDALQAVDALLRNAGHRASMWNSRRTERTHYHFAYEHPRGFVTEIHWHLTRPERTRGMDLAAVWRASEAATIAGRPVRVLALCDLLPHMAEHFAKHAMGLSLRPLCDFDQVVRRHAAAIDWGTVRARAEKWGVERGLVLAVNLASSLLGTELPRAARIALPPSELPLAVLDDATREVLAGGERPTALTSHGFTRLMSAESAGEWWRRAAESVFVTREEVQHQFRLPAGSWRTYPSYLRRWADQVRRYGPSLLEGAGGDPQRRTARARIDLAEWLDAPLRSVGPTPPA
jgi:hypothetical protein